MRAECRGLLFSEVRSDTYVRGRTAHSSVPTVFPRGSTISPTAFVRSNVLYYERSLGQAHPRSGRRERISTLRASPFGSGHGPEVELRIGGHAPSTLFVKGALLSSHRVGFVHRLNCLGTNGPNATARPFISRNIQLERKKYCHLGTSANAFIWGRPVYHLSFH
jgi:hypothetical protein